MTTVAARTGDHGGARDARADARDNELDAREAELDQREIDRELADGPAPPRPG